MLQPKQQTFNRTSVELKQHSLTTFCLTDLTFNRTSVELKHRINAKERKREAAFNRTSVELKLDASS